MEHDSPTLLFTLAQEYLISAKAIRPGVTILAKMVATARTSAGALTFEKLAHLLTAGPALSLRSADQVAD
jgi:hypothetical protein